MDISGCSFSELSYSTLFNTYLTDFDKLKSFYSFNPLDENEISRRAGSIPKTTQKEQYIQALSEYHKVLGISEDQKDALEKLSQDNALAIVTGQQLGVYGGPLFTIYKTMTAILLSRKYEKELGQPVVPVFWLADEDHDFEEIAWAGITGRNDFNKIKLDQQGKGIPVSEEEIGSEIQAFKAEVKEELFDTDFTESLWRLLDKHYKQGNTHAQAFAGLINEWFSNEGILIAGSNYKPIKDVIASTFNRSVKNSDAIYQAIETKSSELEEIFHRQVMNGDSNLFYLSEKEGRIKIHRDEETWTAGSISWSKSELLDEIDHHPEKFSPNVFLRPIIQDKLLPTLGYVAGPGELAYYGQMNSMYREFELEMPPIFPRYTATIIESGISRIIEKLPFKVTEYEKRIEDLESKFIERTETEDIEKVFAEWKSRLDAAAEEPLKVINDIDPTLEGMVGKTVAGFTNELDKLKGRVYRSIKKQEETQIKRIEKIKVNLFPDGGLQERSVSPVYFMNKYGLDIWKNLLTAIEEEGLDLTEHHLIEI
ncbi:MAG TPA: bacillithiol biosynthesis cysteine-adding enzyme BshC [Gracilimonas sp.]|uniref:bacillithiol biosynthesis cysteine-adding enzyme BshC n=1 Tax=Gracilimonas sp. TaxID=1974203 RepID=UPI002DB467FB|nr:bacillithiol biosynthesis cysteine-adding enzyme BshC [Gracilimonas sp.]